MAVVSGERIAEPGLRTIKIQGIDHVALSVADLDRGVRFYTEVLGLRPIRRFGEPRQALMACGKSLLMLIEVKDYPGLLNITKSRSHISMLVSKTEFQRAVEILQERHVRIIYGPERHRDGKRLILLDADENKIELAYPKTKV